MARRLFTLVVSAVLVGMLAPVPFGFLVKDASATHRIVVVGLPCAVVGSTVPVSIKDDFFDPENIFIQKGQIVEWTNVGQNDHTSTSDGIIPLWDSGIMHNGDHFDAQFCSKGLFPYHCAVHGFHGNVTVT